MMRRLARFMVAMAVLAAPVVVVAPAAHASVADCVYYAVDHGADEDIAADACGQDTLTGCYRIFRDNYGRQQWALEACRMRTADD